MPAELTLPGFDDAVEAGWGGFAVVYRARQVSFDREVAIKVLKVHPGTDLGEAFRRECAAIGSLSGHPNIVVVHGLGETPDGRPFIVMEYLHGGSFGDLVRAGGPLPWREAAAIGVEVAGALETAHLAGLLHRDVKPENVLVPASGARRSATSASPGCTAPSTLAAAAWPAAPAPGAGGAGRRPAVDRVRRVLTRLDAVQRLAGRPPPVEDLRPDGVPDAVCRVVEQALDPEPSRRQASAQEVGRQLQEALAAAVSP